MNLKSCFCLEFPCHLLAIDVLQIKMVFSIKIKKRAYLFRCLVFASFILTGMFVKTVLTVGFAQTVEKISAFNMGTAEQLVTSDKYLRNSLARATLNTFFLVVAWTLIGRNNNITLSLVDVFHKRWRGYKGNESFAARDYEYICELQPTCPDPKKC